jgi:hypothetical protein
VAWLGDPRVAFIGAGEDTGGATGERKGRHQWWPVWELMGASGKGNDEMDISKGGERNRRHFGSTSWCTGAGQEGEQARRGGGSRSMAALGFNTEEGERGEWAGWAKWPHRPDEAGLVREESWTRLQESLGQNRFGPLEK